MDSSEALSAFCADAGAIMSQSTSRREAPPNASAGGNPADEAGGVVEGVERSIDAALTRLDEMETFVDSVKVSNAGSKRLVAETQRKAAALMSVFARVDRLEEVVRAAERSVAAAEARVKAMNREYKQSAVTRMLSSLSFMGGGGGGGKKGEAAEWPPPDFLFSADEHLGKRQQQQQ